MPAISTIIAVASLAVAAGSASYSGYVAKDNALDAEHEAGRQADEAAAVGRTEAAQIRERGRRLSATQSAALAASGVQLDPSGTSGAILDETNKLTESDALLALNGAASKATALREQGKIIGGQGTSAAVSAGLSGVGGILGATSSYLSAKNNSNMADWMNNQAPVRRTGQQYSLLGNGSGLKFN